MKFRKIELSLTADKLIQYSDPVSPFPYDLRLINESQNIVCYYFALDRHHLQCSTSLVAQLKVT